MNDNLKNIVGGVEVNGYDSELKVGLVDPMTGMPLPTDFPLLNEATMHANRVLHVNPASIEQRAAFLDQIANEIEQLGDELLSTANEETALPLPRLTGERGRTCGQLRLFAKVLREGTYFDAVVDAADPARSPLPKPHLVMKSIPLGTVAVFGASNFPLAFSVAGGDTASALAAGCPVIVKAHPAHPRTSQLVASAIVKAIEAIGIDKGYFALIHGGAELSQALVKHPFISAVGFTGSQVVGKTLFALANERPIPIPVFAEMGSINPVFFLPSAVEADAEELAKAYFGSLTMGVGQFCTNPGVVFAQKGEALERFVSTLSELASASTAGTMLTDGIAASFDSASNEMKASESVTVVSSGAVSGRQVSPTIVRCSQEEFLKKKSLQHEVFGPFGIVVEVEQIEHFLTIPIQLEGQLTATIHVKPEAPELEIAIAQILVQGLARKAGRVLMNGFPTGVEVSPAMVHGGPFPATTDPRFTSVGTTAIKRWLRPVCYQDIPEIWL